MRSYEPNWPLSSKNIMLVGVLAAFAVALFNENRIANDQRANSLSAMLNSVINKRTRHAIHIPKLIHRNHAKMPEYAQLPFELPAVVVKPNEASLSTVATASSLS